jgi:hypothetical protein
MITNFNMQAMIIIAGGLKKLNGKYQLIKPKKISSSTKKKIL